MMSAVCFCVCHVCLLAYLLSSWVDARVDHSATYSMSRLCGELLPCMMEWREVSKWKPLEPAYAADDILIDVETSLTSVMLINASEYIQLIGSRCSFVAMWRWRQQICVQFIYLALSIYDVIIANDDETDCGTAGAVGSECISYHPQTVGLPLSRPTTCNSNRQLYRCTCVTSRWTLSITTS